jgi:hypothetical protein
MVAQSIFVSLILQAFYFIIVIERNIENGKSVGRGLRVGMRDRRPKGHTGAGDQSLKSASSTGERMGNLRLLRWEWVNKKPKET